MKNRKKYMEFMNGMAAVFDKEVNKILIDVYWKILEPYTDEQCEKALNTIITTSKFWPKPAELIEVIQGGKSENAVLAWIKTDKAVRNHGPYVSVKFDDPVIHGVIEILGGWPKFQDCTSDEWKWRQKEFERLYRIVEFRGGDRPEYLPGIIEIDNQARGYSHSLKVVMIGGDERKMLI